MSEENDNTGNSGLPPEEGVLIEDSTQIESEVAPSIEALVIDAGVKRTVTQEELDIVYAEMATLAVAGADNASALSSLAGQGAPSGSQDAVGVHIGKDRTNVVFLSKKGHVDSHVPLNVGYENGDALLTELSHCLSSVSRKRVPVFLTLTGSPSPSFIASLPKLNRATMLKALRLQYKQHTGQETDDLHYVSVAGKRPAEGNTPYLVSSMEKGFLEKTVRHLKKLKIRVMAWDVDLLCHARAASLLWDAHGLKDTTRFLVLLNWDHCNLLIVSPEGKLVAPRLPIGIQSFLQHLMASREASVPKSADDRDWRVLPADPIEVRERKLLASQAIHDVYIPLAQQIKTHLYAVCNEQGIALPTHFGVSATGTNLFHIVESLSLDLSLKAIPIEASFPTEASAAVGAALWDKHDCRLNLLPKGKGELIKSLKELFGSARTKVGPMSLGNFADSLPVSAGALIAVPAVLLLLGLIFPFWQRWKATNLLESRRAELVILEAEKTRIAKSKERELLYDKKVALIKQIELKRLAMSSAIKELFSVVPPTIRLMSVSFKDNMITLKGLAKEHASVQALLRSALELRYLIEPTPMNVKRDTSGTEFEVSFKFRS